MAEMQFSLVSPEAELASFVAEEVQLPGAEGDMTVMPMHAGVITTLRPGVIVARGVEGEKHFAIAGGFAEIRADQISVLAEEAAEADPIDGEIVAKWISEVESLLERSEGVTRDRAEKRLADLQALIP